ncbi:hypothetical protein INR49_030326 [Caranx melampygus]|nr:hypothetical protein INR49_030326 [Caranx melampygus]
MRGSLDHSLHNLRPLIQSEDTSNLLIRLSESVCSEPGWDSGFNLKLFQQLLQVSSAACECAFTCAGQLTRSAHRRETTDEVGEIEMKTLALLALSLAVALAMPAPPGVAQSPDLIKEEQSPLVGDLVLNRVMWRWRILHHSPDWSQRSSWKNHLLK